MIRNITRKAEIINNFFKETKKCDTEKERRNTKGRVFLQQYFVCSDCAQGDFNKVY